MTAEPTIGQRESSGIVFLPTVQPVDEHGRIVGAGDVVAQTEAIFERAERILLAFGLGFDRVVKTVDYITPAALAGYGFAAGSMGPKVEAAIEFATRTGKTAAIGALADIVRITRGEAGTLVTAQAESVELYS